MKNIIFLLLAIFYAVICADENIVLQRNDLNYLDYYVKEDPKKIEDKLEEQKEGPFVEKVNCPSVNIGRSDGIVNCPNNPTYYCGSFFDEDGKSIKIMKADKDGNEALIQQADDCFSQHLYNKNKGFYYNKCCYIRFQAGGTIHNGCVGMTDEQMLDVDVAKKQLEDRYSEIGRGELYISELNCKGSYVMGSLLIALIGFLL